MIRSGGKRARPLLQRCSLTSHGAYSLERETEGQPLTSHTLLDVSARAATLLPTIASTWGS